MGCVHDTSFSSAEITCWRTLQNKRSLFARHALTDCHLRRVYFNPDLVDLQTDKSLLEWDVIFDEILICLCRFASSILAGSQPKSDCARWHYKPAQCGPFIGSRWTQHCSLRFWLSHRPCVLVWHQPRQNLERQWKWQRQDCGELFSFPCPFLVEICCV